MESIRRWLINYAPVAVVNLGQKCSPFSDNSINCGWHGFKVYKYSAFFFSASSATAPTSNSLAILQRSIYRC